MKILERINKTIEYIIGILIGFITIIVIAQVFFRYVLEQPLSSSEELARYCVIWLVMLGFAVLVRQSGNVSVTYFAERFSSKIQKILRISVHFISSVFFIVMIVYGFDLSIKAMIQVTPATGFRMGLVDLVIPIAGVFSLLFTIEHLIKECTSKNDEIKGGS